MSNVRQFPIGSTVTVNEVLERIKVLARQEPKRIHMNYILLRKKQLEGMMNRVIQVPDCGTVGCIDGWHYTLTGKYLDVVLPPRVYDVVCYPETGKNCSIQYNEGNAQTPEYAERVIQHTNEMQERYADEFTRKVTVVAVKKEEE